LNFILKYQYIYRRFVIKHLAKIFARGEINKLAIALKMNTIEEIRNEIKKYFVPNGKINESKIIFSPNRKYRIETHSYTQSKPNCNWEVTKVEVFNVFEKKLLFSFFVNEGTFFHSWLTKEGIEYLLCAEDFCGGQTVMDLSNKIMSSYTTSEDGLIWMKHLLSPNQKLLAVLGCFWGTASFIRVYHFDKPMDLPLQIAYEPNWVGFDMVEWIDNKSLKVLKTENEYEVVELL
jgi:hypothetical protein